MFQSPRFTELLQTATRGEYGFIIVLLVCLVLGLLAQILFQLVVIGCCFVRRERLVRILQPKNFPKGSLWQERAETLLAWLEWLWPAKPRLTNADSPARTYQIVEPLGLGDLCEVSAAIGHGQSFVLKIPRVADCDALLKKEQAVLRYLHRRSRGDLYGEYFPRPQGTFYCRGRQCSAFDMADGYVRATEILRLYPDGLDGRHIAWMFNRTLEALGFVHHCGWIHGAVLPPHLLFHPTTHGLRMVGWIHAERSNRPLRIVPRQYKAWYPPECQRREPATPATDIYLAAQSMVWMAGGDAPAGTMAERLPIEIRSFLTECLAESPAERPQDAWVLHEEFRALLEAVYGPPQFCHLPM